MMKEQEIKTPIQDEYMANLDRSARNFRRGTFVFLFLIFMIMGILLGRHFNPLMDAINRVMMDEARIENESGNWQLIIDAAPGTIFELEDHTLCVLEQSYLKSRMLALRCKDALFDPSRVQEIAHVYPVGSAEWRERRAAFFEVTAQ